MKATFSIEYRGQKLELNYVSELCELQEVIAGLISTIAQHPPQHAQDYAQRFGYPTHNGEKLGTIVAQYSLRP